MRQVPNRNRRFTVALVLSEDTPRVVINSCSLINSDGRDCRDIQHGIRLCGWTRVEEGEMNKNEKTEEGIVEKRID